MKLYDKLVNFAANLGTSRDKQSDTTYEQRILDVTVLEALYSSNGLGGKIIDIPVEDMFKNWATLTGDAITPEIKEAIEDLQKDLCVQDNVADAVRWARLYGGSIVVMGLDGTGPADTPLDLTRVKQGALKFLHVVDREDLSPEDINTTDIMTPLYRKPEFYKVAGSTTKIHASRVLRFLGRPLPWRLAQRAEYWGAPVLQRIFDSLSRHDTVAAATATLIHEANLDVIKVKGFGNLVSTKDGENKLLTRFSVAAYLKSNQNMLILDTEEDYQKKSNNFTGLKDMNGIFSQNLAADADIPVTRLMGVPPAGLNATGASDLENYYESVEAGRAKRIEPELDKLYEVLIRSATGLHDIKFEYDWPPIGPVSELDQATIEKTRMERDTGYINAGVIDASIAAKQLHAEKTYMAIDKEFIAAVDESVELEQEQGEEDRARMIEGEEAALNEQTNNSPAATQE